jgi:hypothetical protein
MARVPPEDAGSLTPLLSRDCSAIGTTGTVVSDVEGLPTWRIDRNPEQPGLVQPRISAEGR